MPDEQLAYRAMRPNGGEQLANRAVWFVGEQLANRSGGEQLANRLLLFGVQLANGSSPVRASPASSST